MRFGSNRKSRYAAATMLVATLVVTTACGSGNSGGGSTSGSTGGDDALPLLNPEADGDLATTGGARRSDDEHAQLIADSIRNTDAKNVILLIGDGMGDSEITLARDYEYGANGAFPGLDSLPLTGQYTHYSLNKDGTPNFVTDSAASGTAWATGTKTYNGAIGVDVQGNPVDSLIDLARANDKSTGNVSTAELQDATPAAQVASVTSRRCYGPEETSEQCPENALENGGAGSITEQLLQTRADVTLGGGAESFQQTARAGEYEGRTLEVQAKDEGYQIVTNADELDAVTEANQDSPLLGLFADGNMPVRWNGPVASRGGYLEPAAECTDNAERTAEVPQLAAMTQKAIDLLKTNDNGFFLQVEGASIDKQDHEANPCGQIGETVDLDEATKVALDFAQQDGDTLVIVTADHAHTSQIVYNQSVEDVQEAADDAKVPFEVARDAIYPGLTRVLTTSNGTPLTVSYATSGDLNVTDQGHTGSQLRIAGYGPSAADVVGLTDQTDLHFTILDALGISSN